MERLKKLLEKRKNDPDFKALTSSFLSLLITVAFALYNGSLGLYKGSLWHGTICVYYLILSVLRALILFSERTAGREADPEKFRNRRGVASSIVLLLLNVSLIVPAALMVKMQKPVEMTLIPAIILASYTTWKVISASVKLKRRKRSANSLVRLLLTITFVDALVSVLTLQNALIAVNLKGRDDSMLTLTAWTSGAIFAFAVLLSLSALVGNIKRMKNTG